MATQQPTFRLLGFPVHVRGGFVIFMILLAVIPRGVDRSFGYWLAGGVAVFTLIHELGHAVVARRAGAEAEISLEFMAGYAAYRSPRPLSRPWTIAISLAGPLTHIAVSVGVLAAMGVNPLDRDSVTATPEGYAVWWAGPVIGAFNLIPVLPLDGGNVVETMLDRIIPGRAHRVMVYGSVAVTVGVLIAQAFVERLQIVSPIFIGFILIMQLAGLFAERRASAVSPFDAAAAALRDRQRDRAAKILVRGLSRPSQHRLVPNVMHGDNVHELRSLVDVLPRPLPSGEPWNEYLLATILVRIGRAREAAEYAAASYAEEPNPLAACSVARAAAALGDNDTATAWLRAALDAGIPQQQLHQLVTGDPVFAPLRARPDVLSLIGAQRAGPPGTVPTVEPRRT